MPKEKKVVYIPESSILNKRENDKLSVSMIKILFDKQHV